MADQPYYSVFTKKGLELLTEAIRNGTKLGITDMAFGDGGGSLPVPDESFTQLVHEVYRTQLNSLAPDPNNANWLRAEAVIASAIGGFNIRELGLYAGDVLVAYSNYPSTYKPNPSDGTARIMTFRMVLQIDNTASFELKIDADIVMATIQSVNEAKQELYENTVSTVKNIKELLTLEKWQGRTVNVLGYETEGFGGDLFVYDASKASVNNNVTIFDGWLRDVSNNYLSTYDAGLVDDGENHSDRFQTMLDCLTDGMTLEVFGTHLVNTNMLISNKNNITVNFSENAMLSAKELRDSFIFKNYDGSKNGSGVRGILHFHQCDNPHVTKAIVQGCQKHNLNAPQPYEDGDSGVAFSICKNPIIEHSKITHTTTWGILAEQCTNAIAQYNDVSNVLRQSGISLTINNGTGGKCLYNKISDVALYGIEWEVYSDSFGNQSTGNIVKNCLKGEAAIGHVCELDSFSNQYINCSQAMDSELSNVENSKLIKYHSNTAINVLNGVVVSNAGIVRILNNLFEVNTDFPSYFITSAYNTVLSVLDSRTFMALGRSSLTVNTAIMINDVVYSIVSIDEITDDIYKSNTLKKVTVDKDLNQVRDMTQIYSNVSNTTYVFFTASSNKNILISGNTAKSYSVCFKTDGNNSSTDVTERMVGNTFINCDAYLELNGQNYNFTESNNVLINVGNSKGTYLSQMADSVFTAQGTLDVYQKMSSDALRVKKNYYFYQNITCIGAIISFPNADAKCTSTVVLQMDDNQNIVTIAPDQFNSTYNVVKFLNHLSSGNHTFMLTDTVGDLSYTEAIVKLIYS